MNTATFSSFPKSTKGRLIPEEACVGRTDFQRDRDRIIHSTAFRRLEYKTQVFINHEGDHYRTRLTHSIEVAQIARSIARTLGVNEDLTETIALAHDLGHTPFGHAGEAELNEMMSEHGGFDHNSQTLKILTKLEKCYADFDGLNLTWETLEGVVKHHGKWEGEPIRYVKEYNKINDLQLGLYSSLEGQIANLADDIAYNNHDMDDGLRAEMFSIKDISELPMVGEVFHDVGKKYPHLIRSNHEDKYRLIREVVRRIISAMILDLVAETRRRLAEYGVKTVDDIRRADAPMVAFSGDMERNCRDLKKFLRVNMYKHPHVSDEMERAKKVVRDLYEYYYFAPQHLPAEWQDIIEGKSPHPNPPPQGGRELQRRHPEGKKAEIVADFIAGMTDRYALQIAEEIK